MALASGSLVLPVSRCSLPPSFGARAPSVSTRSAAACCRFHSLKKFSIRWSGVVASAAPKAAVPAEDLNKKVAESIKEAQEICAGNEETGECAAAWDEVEELSAAISHKRSQGKATPSDPLESFCKDNPESDECRVYED